MWEISIEVQLNNKKLNDNINTDTNKVANVLLCIFVSKMYILDVYKKLRSNIYKDNTIITIIELLVNIKVPIIRVITENIIVDILMRVLLFLTEL